MTNIRVRIPREIWQEIKIHAIRQGKPVEMLAGEILKEWLRRVGDERKTE